MKLKFIGFIDMTRIIECAIGHIEVTDDGEFIYHGGQTDNGWCFKDYKSWEEGNGIIYISEYQLQDIEDGMDEASWTRDLLEQEVSEELEVRGYPKEMWNNKAFVSALAYYVLTICDWQDLSTYLDELLSCEDIEDMYYGRGFFSNIKKEW